MLDIVGYDGFGTFVRLHAAGAGLMPLTLVVRAAAAMAIESIAVAGVSLSSPVRSRNRFF